MTIAAEKPTVREAVAAALSEGRQDRAGVLGSAQMLRDDEGHVLVHQVDGAPERDGRDLGLELAALLLRAKYAHDYSGLRMAGLRFAVRLRVRAKRQTRSKGRYDPLIIALSTQSIAEWVADQCERCKGTGLRGARMGGMLEFMRACPVCSDFNDTTQRMEPTGMIEYAARGVRPDGKIAPRAAAFRATPLGMAMLGDGVLDKISIQCPGCRGMRYTLERKRVHQRFGKVCQACDGDGEAPPRYAERARALGIGLDNYTRCWHDWFVWAGHHLTALDKTLVNNLRCELGRGYSPAS